MGVGVAVAFSLPPACFPKPYMPYRMEDNFACLGMGPFLPGGQGAVVCHLFLLWEEDACLGWG